MPHITLLIYSVISEARCTSRFLRGQDDNVKQLQALLQSRRYIIIHRHIYRVVPSTEANWNNITLQQLANRIIIK